ncbi:LIM and calponin homology domains-containing protein 1a isoform X4 [Astyanax mexicanus]|uniref:LIM and calponin homology domains-containing protein 1a isoform X4 n=1 Tax=Astyanax mexicanus TaxID=7994 RepID=UPI0020CB39B3|nr:LIM and calponin homology domains-containing protein 1a isoform X4 [Astyanax mexicanus]
MASPNEEQQHQHEAGETSQEPAVLEAQKWIEAVTGRSFGEKDFRSGLENGILLCELLSSIKPGLVKKINRLPTPIAGLDNLTMFLRGCEELGLKGTQLFDPGDLQDTSTRANLTGSDLSRKLKNVLITIYWLGKTANSCTSYNGPTLDLKEFEGLLSMMRKECVSEESDSPKRNIRDSGYIDNWESERSDSLSPPRHGRDDSFDSLDSFGSRSQNTPSPDTVLRGNSDDSEGDGGSRRLPDVRKDDMSARRVSYKEPRAVVPFNQYLPNRSNQTNYIPAPLRKRRSEREEEWRSTSNATSPVSGEKPLREECVGALKEEGSSTNSQRTVTWAVAKGVEPELGEELKKIRKLEKAGIKVLPASVRYNNSAKVIAAEPDQLRSPSPDIILRRDNEFMRADHPHDWDANEDDDDEDEDRRVPDVQKDDLASRRARMNQPRPGVTRHFLPVGCSKKDQERWEGIRLASQHAVLERMEKMEQEKRSEHAPNTAPASASESPLALVSDVKRSSAERDSALELRLTEKVKVEKEYEEKEDKEEEEEEEEEENEKDRQPDVEKDDMMARRTGLFQKGMSGTSYNQFLPLPGTRKKVAPVGQKEGSPLSRSAVVKDPLMLERNIKTKRFKIGQRADPVNTDPPSVSHKEPTVLSSASAHSDDYDDQRDDEGPLPDLEKDDMLARRAVLHHKQSGSQVQAFNVFLPKPGAAKRKTATAGGQNQGSEKEKKPTAESAVTPPSADVHNTPEKGPQMLDRQEAGTEGVMGGRSAVLGGANAKSPSPKPDPTPRRPFWLEDDDLPPTFSHKAANVSDESESVSLIDMRDEEEVDTLSPHSQLRHERLHNQYNKLREEEDQWQDDLARWKNRRRSASQDLIKKEEERKMMEKLMLKEEGGPRRKSIKTYKEIVEEKERREHELHELYCTASTPEEKAAVLQRYALRFTISDAILEKLQLPKLPSASTPEITPSPTHSRQQTTYTLNEEAELPVDLQPALTLQHQTQPHQHMPQTSVHSLPKTPELIPAPVPKVPKVPKIPEVPHSPTRIPPPPSKPVPLLTPKPYSQPKLNQASHKSVKTDGLVRLNGECGVEETRETPAVTPVVRPVTFCPAPPKPPAKTHQQEPEVSPSSESIAPQTTQTLSTVSSQIKEETDAPCSPQEKSSEEETSSTLTHSEITEEKQTVSNTTVKRNCVIKTTIVTELTQIHPVPTTDMSSTDQLSSSDASAQKPSDEVSSADSRQADDMSQSLSLTDPSLTSSNSRLRWEFFAPTDGLDFTSECIETPILNLAKRVDHWTWDPNEERKRQERWQQEQERLLQEKYQQEQERLKKEWEKAQKEVEEEERKHNEEERRILEETTTPLTPSISAQSPPAVTECPAVSTPPQDSVVLSLADWDKKREMLEKQQKNGVEHSTDQAEAIAPAQQNGQGAEHQESQSATPQLQFIQDGTWSSKSESRSEWKKTASLDRNTGPSQAQPPRMRRSVSGKKLCSSCAHPLGKGAAMIIETLGLYFHIQCFKCGVCKGLLGDTSTGTDVRIRNGVLNCQDCYIKSRAAGQPTTL